MHTAVILTEEELKLVADGLALLAHHNAQDRAKWAAMRLTATANLVHEREKACNKLASRIDAVRASALEVEAQCVEAPRGWQRIEGGEES